MATLFIHVKTGTVHAGVLVSFVAEVCDQSSIQDVQNQENNFVDINVELRTILTTILWTLFILSGENVTTFLRRGTSSSSGCRAPKKS
jgi:hypothetical protein